MIELEQLLSEPVLHDASLLMLKVRQCKLSSLHTCVECVFFAIALSMWCSRRC